MSVQYALFFAMLGVCVVPVFRFVLLVFRAAKAIVANAMTRDHRLTHEKLDAISKRVDHIDEQVGELFIDE